MDDDGWLILILGILGLMAVVTMFGRTTSTVVSPPVKVLQPVISNEETWHWTDWEGKQRSIEIHRTVRTDGSA